jgi:hypothetical protein
MAADVFAAAGNQGNPACQSVRRISARVFHAANPIIVLISVVAARGARMRCCMVHGR